MLNYDSPDDVDSEKMNAMLKGIRELASCTNINIHVPDSKISKKTILDTYSKYKSSPFYACEESPSFFISSLSFHENKYLIDYELAPQDNCGSFDELFLKSNESDSFNSDFHCLHNFLNNDKKKIEGGKLDLLLNSMLDKENENDTLFYDFENELGHHVGFKNGQLAEHLIFNNNFSFSLIEMNSGYKRLNALFDMDGGFLRVVYSFNESDRVENLSIYALDEDFSIKDSVNGYSVFQLLNLENGDLFTRYTSFFKDGVKEFNSKLYLNFNFIAKSIFSVREFESHKSLQSEPIIKGFDFYKDKDDYNDHKNSFNAFNIFLSTFLNGEHKPKKSSGLSTIQNIEKIIPNRIDGRVKCTNLEVNKLLFNTKPTIKIENLFDENVFPDLENMSELEAKNVIHDMFYQPLIYQKMLNSYNGEINPFWGERIFEYGNLFKVSHSSIFNDDFVEFETNTIGKIKDVEVPVSTKSYKDVDIRIENFNLNVKGRPEKILIKIIVLDNVKLNEQQEETINALGGMKYKENIYFLDGRRFNFKIINDYFDNIFTIKK